MCAVSYVNSSQCTLLIDQTRDVSVSIHTPGVIWALTSYLENDDIGAMEIHGDGDPPSKPFSLSPLTINPSVLTVCGFSTLGGGSGPVHSGLVIITPHLWAGAGVREVRLGIDGPVNVYFGFGREKPSLVKPWENGAGGTVFKWPGGAPVAG